MTQDNALEIATDIVDEFSGKTFGEPHDATDWLVISITKGMEMYLADELQETTYVSHSLHEKLLQVQYNKIAALREALQMAVDMYGKEGDPWNVPSSRGSWIYQAKEVLKNVT